MEKTYEDILQEVIDNATIEDIFNIEILQKMQDEFAQSLGIASIITDLDGNLVTRPSNFTCLCSDYVRTTGEGLKKCVCSYSLIGSNANREFAVGKCLSAGLIDGGVSFYIGKRHIANWVFGQIKYNDEMPADNVIIEKALSIDIDPEDFEREYIKVPVMDEERFGHVARFASIIAKKYSDEAYLKCVHIAEQKYKIQIEKYIKLEKERLQTENEFDFLTNLYNRNMFEHEIKNLELAQTVPIAVVVADVNNLKLTNDIFGHKFGDQLLAEISRIMIQESFDGFILGRCGGDEFNVIIPGGKRQDAEWYCRRIKLELARNYNCCIMPSIAFGISKKSHIEEDITDIMEIADQKMYRNKIQMKQSENFVKNLTRVLIGKKRITQEILDLTKEMTTEFSEFLGFDCYEHDMFVRLTHIHNFGVVVLSDEDYENRFEVKHSIARIRELSKVPIVNSKIANLYSSYANTAPLLHSFYENYNGTGYPDEKSGNDIPKLSRYARIICDYIYMQCEKPIGLGKDKKNALKFIVKHSGKLYDPAFVQKFKEFIEQRDN